MSLLRQADATSINSPEAILASYDLQAGSYVEAMSDPEHRAGMMSYAAGISRLVSSFGAESIVEAGVGEATTLAHVVGQLPAPMRRAAGFDISWSRIAHGKRYAQNQGVDLSLLVGDLFAIPISDGAFDVVYTSHSMEPNRGREKEALQELYRVAHRYLILIEPASTLGNAATMKRIAEHRYCENLPGHARELGYNVIEHRLFDVNLADNNQSELIVIEKPQLSKGLRDGAWLACPVCHTNLRSHKSHFYCEECCLIYPVIDEVPCLLTTAAIVGTHFTEL